jgi:flagellar motor switch protein FliM
VDVEIESNQNMRFGEYIETLPNPTLISIVKAVEWNSFIILRVDESLTYGLIDILFGGRKVEPNLKVEGRMHTSIEQSIVQSIADVFLNELSAAFDPISPITFNLERIESNPKFATIARPEDIAIVLRLKMKMESRSGYIDLVIPHSSLDPIKKILQKSFLGDRISKDQSWQSHMHTEIANSTVTLSVYLNGITSTIKSIANLKVGDTIILDKEPDEDIFITIGKLKITSGKIGKMGDNVAIKLSDEINLNKYKS